MTLERDIQLAESAKAVLENEAYSLAFDMLTQELTNTWQNSTLNQSGADARERAFLMLKMAQAMRANLDSLILSGRMAQEKRQSLLDRAKASLPEWMSGSD